MMGLYYMNKEQKQFKLLIKSDLRIVERNWEADCRYYPMKVVRKTSINAAYKVIKQWLESGDTAD